MPVMQTSRPAKTITIDRPRRIRITWSAACEFEEAYGKSVLEAISGTVGARFFTHLAWAGMLHEEPALDIETVKKRIDIFISNGGDINALATDLMGALVSSGIIGKPKEKPEEDPPAEETPEGEAQAVPVEPLSE